MKLVFGVVVAVSVILLFGMIDGVRAEIVEETPIYVEIHPQGFEFNIDYRIENCTNLIIYGNTDELSQSIYTEVRSFIQNRDDIYHTNDMHHAIHTLPNQDGSFEIRYSTLDDENIKHLVDYENGSLTKYENFYDFTDNKWSEGKIEVTSYQNSPTTIKGNFGDFFDTQKKQYTDTQIQHSGWHEVFYFTISNSTNGDHLCFHTRGEKSSEPVKTQLQIANEQIEKLETKKDKKVEKKNVWKERHNTCFDKKEHIKTELSELQSRFTLLESEHTTLQTNSTQTQSQLNEALFTIEKLTTELNEAKKKIEELES